MGMSNYANYADVIPVETINQFVDTKPFYNKLKELGYTFDDFCQDMEWSSENIDSTSWDQLLLIYNKILTYFESTTNAKLEVVYHKAENRGDDLDGGAWSCYNLTIPNPDVPKKIHETVNRHFYVTYG